MIIAVHISFPVTKTDPSKNFNYRCFTILAGKYPEHQFIFIYDRPFDVTIHTKDNIEPVLLSPQIKNRLLGHYWYNYKLPKLLNKYNPDIFIGDGMNVSLRSKIKQCMILQDLSLLQKENLFAKADNRYYKKHFRQFVTKASGIAATNQHTSAELAKMYPQFSEKIQVIGLGVNERNKDITADKIQSIKDRFTDGKEYFIGYITDVSAPNAIVLLKAFSAFKKRQLSNMQLVLAITPSQKENLLKDFATYKYREEVKMVVPESDGTLAEITAASYAAIYLPGMEIVEDKGLMALKNNVPLITVSNEFCKSLYNDAALYAKISEANIAEKMMLLYKNENLKNDLANIGNMFGTIYSWDNTAINLWQSILHTTGQ
jgi:hypothetical protein